MKKLLVLVLVLGIASIANAALTYTISAALVDHNVTYDISGSQLIGTGNSAGAYSASIDKTGGTTSAGILSLGDTDKGVGAGWTSNAGVGSAADYFPYMVVSSQSVGEVTQTTGVAWFVFDISGMTVGETMIMQASNEADNWAYGSAVTITAVPEPMTIALLGLGGLFLRRRK